MYAGRAYEVPGLLLQREELTRPSARAARPAAATVGDDAAAGGVDLRSMDDEELVIETSGPLFEQVRDALELVRPAIQSDGGDVRLIEIEDGAIAIVELLGKCVGCPMSEMTVRYGIEATLRHVVPQIMAVDVVQDRSVPVRNFTDVLERATFKPLG